MPEIHPEGPPASEETRVISDPGPQPEPTLVTEPTALGPAPVASRSEASQEQAPMLEVHAPHESVHSWKDVFIHIAIIVVGLLIAVGLDNAVEFIHHRYQIAETRKDLRIERRININHFAMQTEEFHRFVPKLQTNLAVLEYLKAHPHAPRDQWPGKLSSYHMMSRYTDAAWRTAQQNNVLSLMPDQEVQQYDQLYRQLNALVDNMAEKEDASFKIVEGLIETPDPAQMSPEQIDRAIEGYAHLLSLYGRGAVYQRVLASHFPDFKPATTYADEQQVLNIETAGPNSAEDIRKLDEMVGRLQREDDAVARDEGQSDTQ